MKTEVKLITPAIAEEMLKHNNMNRLALPERILEYSRIMNAGQWREETGEAIKIAIDGTLLDGQQRLIALVKAKVSLNFLVITGLEKDVFRVLDTGKTRNAGDIFHIAGVPNAKNTASIISRYLDLKKGTTAFAEIKSLYSLKTTKSELLSLYYKRSKFWDGVYLMAQSWYRQSSHILKTAEYGGLFAYFSDINSESAFLFLDNLGNGTNLSEKNPIKQLREKLIFSKINPKFNLTANQRLALIYKAWNLFRDGKEISYLKFNPETDNFPIPK